MTSFEKPPGRAPIKQPEDMGAYFRSKQEAAKASPPDRPIRTPETAKREAETRQAVVGLSSAAAEIQSILMKLEAAPSAAETQLDDASDGGFLMDALRMVRAVNGGDTPAPGFYRGAEALADTLDKLAANGRLDRIHKADVLRAELQKALESSGLRHAA